MHIHFHCFCRHGFYGRGLSMVMTNLPLCSQIPAVRWVYILFCVCCVIIRELSGTYWLRTVLTSWTTPFTSSLKPNGGIRTLSSLLFLLFSLFFCSRWKLKWRAWTKRGTSLGGCTSKVWICRWHWLKMPFPRSTLRPSAVPTTRPWYQQRTRAERKKKR